MELCQTVRVDYLTVVLDIADALKILDFEDWLEGGSSNMPGYDRRYSGPFGARAHVAEDKRILVQLSGQYWAALGSAWCRRLSELVSVALRINRVDLALDVPLGSVVPKLRSAVEGGHVTGCRQYKIITSPSGSTVYLGSRQSDVMLRCYDARGVDRVELELKGSYAKMAARFLARGSVEATFQAALSRFKVVTGSGKNRARTNEVSWWAALRNLTQERITVAREVVELSLDRTVAWIERGVRNALAAAVEYRGSEWLRDLLDSGTSTRYKSMAILESRVILGAL